MVRDFRMKSRAGGIFGILLWEVSTFKRNWLCDSWYHIAVVAFILVWRVSFPQILGIPICLQTILVKVDLSLQLMSYDPNYYWSRGRFKRVFAPSQLVSAIGPRFVLYWYFAHHHHHHVQAINSKPTIRWWWTVDLLRRNECQIDVDEQIWETPFSCKQD